VEAAAAPSRINVMCNACETEQQCEFEEKKVERFVKSDKSE
jgi:hypothetical protein